MTDSVVTVATTVGEQIKALEDVDVLAIRVKGGWVTLAQLRRGFDDPSAKAREPVTYARPGTMPWAGTWCPVVTRNRVVGWQAIDISEDMGLPLYGPAGDQVSLDEADRILEGNAWCDLRELDDEADTPDDGQRILLEVLHGALSRAVVDGDDEFATKVEAAIKKAEAAGE